MKVALLTICQERTVIQAKGKRCYGIHNWNAKGRTNVIGAIINFSFLTLGMFESTINSNVFLRG